MVNHLIYMKKEGKTSQDSNSQTDQAYNLIEEMILNMDIAPGASVSEATLSAMTGIGRTPIRLALKLLEHQGLITSLPRKGVFIRQLKVEDELAILEIRRPVEKLMVCKAARLTTQAQRESLRFCSECMVQAAIVGDTNRFLHFDRECDRIVYETSRNPYASDFIQMLYAHSRRFWKTYSSDTDWANSSVLHSALMHAIADGDEDKAAAACDELINFLESFCKGVIGIS